MYKEIFFFHPDYTVGVGVSPTQLALADYTAGRELHPALKNIRLFLTKNSLAYVIQVVKQYYLVFNTASHSLALKPINKWLSINNNGRFISIPSRANNDSFVSTDNVSFLSFNCKVR